MTFSKILFYSAFILFMALITFQIWDNISLIIKSHSTIHTDEFGNIPAVISEDTSKYKPYGIIFLKLIILAATLSFLIKQSKNSFIVFNSILIPFFGGFVFLEIKNKFEGYDFSPNLILLLVSIISIYLVLLFWQPDKVKKIVISIKDVCLMVFGILISIISYLLVFYKI